MVCFTRENWGTTGGHTGGNEMHFADLIAQWMISGRTMVHDYQLTTIGAALNYHGYSFNWMRPTIGRCRKLLIEVKPHLFAISSDHQPCDAFRRCVDDHLLDRRRQAVEHGHSVHSVCLGKEGGEVWRDYYAIPKGVPHSEAAYALINFMLDPEMHANMSRCRQPQHVPEEILNDPILIL